MNVPTPGLRRPRIDGRLDAGLAAHRLVEADKVEVSRHGAGFERGGPAMPDLDVVAVREAKPGSEDAIHAALANLVEAPAVHPLTPAWSEPAGPHQTRDR